MGEQPGRNVFILAAARHIIDVRLGDAQPRRLRDDCRLEGQRIIGDVSNGMRTASLIIERTPQRYSEVLHPGTPKLVSQVEPSSTHDDGGLDRHVEFCGPERLGNDAQTVPL